MKNTANNKKNVKGEKPLILVILGPTSSGKTALGVKIAAILGGEIISADSRQVYRGLDIGSGKDLQEYSVNGKTIPYHLIDVADPKDRFDLSQYKKLAIRAINSVLAKGKLPIVVGGSGLYLQAIVDNYQLSAVGPDWEQRKKLEKMTAAQLFARLADLKPDFAARLNNSDRNNPRRLIRYLEIADQANPSGKKRPAPYDFSIWGIDYPDDILRSRIVFRLLSRLEKEGLVAEVHDLNERGLSWERLESFGLEYRFVSRYLRGLMTYQEMVEKLSTAIYRFAKRQKTWLKRWEKQGRKIQWIHYPKQAEKIIQESLKK